MAHMEQTHFCTLVKIKYDTKFKSKYHKNKCAKKNKDKADDLNQQLSTGTGCGWASLVAAHGGRAARRPGSS